MHSLDHDFATKILDHVQPPCLSLYQPTHRHHPENRQDPIRFKNLVKTLEASLHQGLEPEEIKALLQPFEDLGKDREFWEHTGQGLAVLGGKDFFRVYKLLRPVKELAVVADTLHTKPLIRILQSVDRYQVLALDQTRITLFEGDRDFLEKMEPAADVPQTREQILGEQEVEPHLTVASYGGSKEGHPAMHHGQDKKQAAWTKNTERFFRAVDRGILEHHSQPSGLPLILVCLPELQHVFRKVSENPFLLDQGVNMHPHGLTSTDQLREKVWEIMEPGYLKNMTGLVEEFQRAKANGMGDSDPAHAAKAIVQGRAARVLIQAQMEIPGKVDEAGGEITFADLSDPSVDDILDDLGFLARKRGAEVFVLPGEHMPDKTGIAAVYRY